MSWRAESFSSDRPSRIRSFVGAIPSNVMTQVTCWMISVKKSYLRVFGLGNFLNFLECSRLIRRKRQPRFRKRQVFESLFDLLDPKRFQTWLNQPLNVSSFPNIIQTDSEIADLTMNLEQNYRLTTCIDVVDGELKISNFEMTSKTLFLCFVPNNLHSLIGFRPYLCNNL